MFSGERVLGCFLGGGCFNVFPGKRVLGCSLGGGGALECFLGGGHQYAFPPENTPTKRGRGGGVCGGRKEGKKKGDEEWGE